MCGFAGWFDLRPRRPGASAEPVSAARRRAVLDELAPRGPDGEGEFQTPDGRIGLLHRRLAVVDPRGGDQPMRGPGRAEALAWNGEVFDHAEHRRRLEGTGATFSTRSDTEVLAHLLHAEGTASLARIRAQYALAWVSDFDDAERPATLLLARDRAGEKPLYWTEQEGRIWFASTLAALRALVALPARIDRRSLSLYLSWGFVPAPATILEGVHKLEAGQWLRFDSDGGREEGRLPAFESAERPPPGGEVEALREVLADAARIRLESADVPVGVFLSAGLDSLAVTAVLRDVPGLQTFTVRSRDPRQDEADDAALAARCLGVEHHVVDPPPDDPGGWRRALLRYGEPFAAGSAVALDTIARAARTRITVALTGDGGDEALGGYARHVLLRRMAWVARLPVPKIGGRGRMRRMRRFLELTSYRPAERYAAMYEVFGPWRTRLVPGDDGGIGRGLICDLWDGAPPGDLDAMLRVDRALELPDAHCVKTDVACMGNGLEARSPWLDPRVVALCDALPEHERIRGRTTKVVLRRLLAAEFPDEIGRKLLQAPKRGFSTGFEDALRGTPVRELLLGGSLDRFPELQRDGVHELLSEHAERRGNHLFRLMTLIALALFSETL